MSYNVIIIGFRSDLRTFEIGGAVTKFDLITILLLERDGYFLFLNRKIANPAQKRKKNKLFAVSGVLVQFRTQGNGRFASANWNFQFQFFHIRNKMFKILVPYSTLRSFLNSLPAFLDFGSAFFENFGFVLGYPMNFKCSYFHIVSLSPPHHIHVTFPA